jgi:hypothetical protein
VDDFFSDAANVVEVVPVGTSAAVAEEEAAAAAVVAQVVRWHLCMWWFDVAALAAATGSLRSHFPCFRGEGRGGVPGQCTDGQELCGLRLDSSHCGKDGFNCVFECRSQLLTLRVPSVHWVNTLSWVTKAAELGSSKGCMAVCIGWQVGQVK